MTEIGAGGVTIRAIKYKRRFKKDRRKLPQQLLQVLDEKLQDLFKDPMPPGLRFEKLQGYRKPSLYTIHITGNYKVSMEIDGNIATLRRVGTHNEIDRQP